MTDPQRIIPLTTLLGAAALWLMLPRGNARGRAVGMLLAAVALGLGASQFQPLGGWTANGLFLLLAGVTVVAALGAVTFRNPVYCAIWFGQMLVGVAGLYLFTGAEFLAVATLAVYAGAILVTFLFVLMLAQPQGDAPYDRVSWEALLSSTTGAVIVGIFTTTLVQVLRAAPVQSMAARLPAEQAGGGLHVLAAQHMAQLGAELFARHGVAVEVAGTLLLAAVVGAAVIVAHGPTAKNRTIAKPIPSDSPGRREASR